MRLSHPSYRMKRRALRVLLHGLVASGSMAGNAWAQPVTPVDDAVAPTPSASSTPAQRRNAPVFLQGDRIYGRTDLDTVVQGDAIMRKAETTIRADRLEYDQPTDQARATGRVRIDREGNVYEGPLLELKVESFEGFFQNPSYHFAQNDAHGEASRADFLDQNHTVVHDATYTTCRRLPGPDWVPDWVLRATSISLDNEEEVGVANGAYLSFKGVPILPVPAISFPLTEKRKSGLLPLTVGVDSISGTTLALPYYWNIAPNRDATITPTLMTARGVDLAVNYRYLEPNYSGYVFVDSMPADKLRDKDRWGFVMMQNGSLNTGLPNVSPVAVALNINRVSDDNYWSDFNNSQSSLAQRLLPGEVLASWSSGALSGTVHVLKWQVLQDPTSPIIPPYDLAPQLTAHYGQNNMQGFDWSLDGDLTQFSGNPTLTGQPNTQRAFVLAQISHPWLAPQGFVTPKLQLHAAAYQFDSRLADGSQSATSVVPTFSLDSGLVFERNSTLWGREFLQTLEPRAFYVYTPYHNQSLLPNYDTGLADFNFASIYSENAFVGNDKISDNNLLTMGVTTRFLDPETGNQYARFGVAQRLRFDPQLVTLNAATSPAEVGVSDLLLGAEVNLNERWTLDSTTQYNPLTHQSDLASAGARYTPGPYRVLNAAYRFQRNVSEQLDLSWQWPMSDLLGKQGQESGQGLGENRYYAVGRLNYSLDQSAMVDSLLGVEYDAGCWLARIVYARTQTSTSSAVQRLIFQLEFVGFTRIGTGDVRTTLTQSIPHYQDLRGTGSASTSHYSNYK
jgi:LPS-assembly protein